MATLYPCHLFSASAHLQASTKLALKNKPPNSIHGFKKSLAQFSEVHAFGQSVKPSRLLQNSRHNISCAMNMTAGQSDDPGQMNHLINKARKLWESSPQPVKIFPWKRAGLNFIQLILDLVLAVFKYLCVPLLAVSSLSEMSYCAQEKKLFFIPVPVIIGMAIAEVLKLAALDVSPLLKDAEVPWHLLVMAIFFTMLKLPEDPKKHREQHYHTILKVAANPNQMNSNYCGKTTQGESDPEIWRNGIDLEI